MLGNSCCPAGSAEAEQIQRQADGGRFFELITALGCQHTNEVSSLLAEVDDLKKQLEQCQLASPPLGSGGLSLRHATDCCLQTKPCAEDIDALPNEDPCWPSETAASTAGPSDARRLRPEAVHAAIPPVSSESSLQDLSRMTSATAVTVIQEIPRRSTRSNSSRSDARPRSPRAPSEPLSPRFPVGQAVRRKDSSDSSFDKEDSDERRKIIEAQESVRQARLSARADPQRGSKALSESSILEKIGLVPGLAPLDAPSPRQIRVSYGMTQVKEMTKIARDCVSTGTEITEQTNKGKYCPWNTRRLGLMMEWLVCFVICLNTIIMGVSADFERHSGVWAVVNMAFAFIYTAELIIKLAYAGLKNFFVGKNRGWNMFDTFVVALAAGEIIVGTTSNVSFTALRMVRICRLTRVVRLFRAPVFKELLMMINGMLGSARTLIWSIVLVSIPLYAVALFLRETLGESTEILEFSSVGWCFLTVFRCVMGECTDVQGRPINVTVTASHGWVCGLLYALFMTFTFFGLFNLIAAIYVENLMDAARSNEIIQQRRRLNDDKQTAIIITRLLEAFMDAYWDNMGCTRPRSEFFNLEEFSVVEIDRDTFNAIMSDAAVNEYLDRLDVSAEDRMGLFEILDADGNGDLQVGEIVAGVMKLRGAARRSDTITCALILRCVQKKFDAFLTSFEDTSSLLDRHSLMLENIVEVNKVMAHKFEGNHKDIESLKDICHQVSMSIESAGIPSPSLSSGSAEVDGKRAVHSPTSTGQKLMADMPQDLLLPQEACGKLAVTVQECNGCVQKGEGKPDVDEQRRCSESETTLPCGAIERLELPGGSSAAAQRFELLARGTPQSPMRAERTDPPLPFPDSTFTQL